MLSSSVRPAAASIIKTERQMTPYEIHVMVEQVLSPARFHDPLVMAIGDVWVDQVPEIRDCWRIGEVTPVDESSDVVPKPK